MVIMVLKCGEATCMVIRGLWGGQGAGVWGDQGHAHQGVGS